MSQSTVWLCFPSQIKNVRPDNTCKPHWGEIAVGKELVARSYLAEPGSACSCGSRRGNGGFRHGRDRSSRDMPYVRKTQPGSKLVPPWNPRIHRPLGGSSLESKDNHLGLFQDLCHQPEPSREAPPRISQQGLAHPQCPSPQLFMCTPITLQMPCWIPLHPQGIYLKEETDFSFL